MSDPFVNAATLEGIASALVSSRDGVDAVLRDRGLRRSTPEHTARSLLIGAAASASLEGDQVEADALAAGGGGATARAALRLSSELLGLIPTWDRSPLQVIARLHALAAAGSVPEADLGRPSNPSGTARLTDLTRALAAGTTAPALAVAAVVHAEIATAGAFGSHDGVVARAAERLVLVARGIDPASVTVPEAAHAAAEHEYRHALEAYAVGDDVGLHRWMTYAADAYGRAAALSPLIA